MEYFSNSLYFVVFRTFAISFIIKRIMKRNVFINYSYNYLKIFKDIKKNEITMNIQSLFSEIRKIIIRNEFTKTFIIIGIFAFLFYIGKEVGALLAFIIK